jgi:hypothetical protein
MTMDISLFKTTPPAPKAIKGWILRAGRSTAFVYWNGDNAISAWSGDHTTAIRFYRQRDALKMQAMMSLYLGSVVPYEWDELPETPVAPTEYATYVVEHKN